MSFRELAGLVVTAFFVFVIAVIWESPRSSGAEPLDGTTVFAKRCSGCHAIEASKEGPRLRGVIGRKAGTVTGFQYSDARRNSGITWTEALVNKWLENPEGLVKDNDMEFHVSNPDERTAVVAYLKSLGN